MIPAPDKQRFYDTIADSFDAVMNPYDLNRRLDVMFARLLRDESLAGKHVLDVGCGTGWFSKQAASLGAQVTSLDIGVRLLKKTREKCDVIAVAGDACHLPFADTAFDVVMSSECIEHTVDPLGAVREMCRVLKPGGTLAVTVPNKVWHWSATFAAIFKLRPYDGFENWVSWGDLRRRLADERMRDVTISGFHLFPPVIRASWPLLRYAEHLGPAVGPLMLNVAVKATR